VKLVETRSAFTTVKGNNGHLLKHPVKAKFVLGIIRVPLWGFCHTVGVRRYNPWSFMPDRPWQVYKRSVWPFPSDSRWALEYCKSVWSALGMAALHTTGVMGVITRVKRWLK